MLRHLVILAALAVLLVPAAPAQEITATITGTVTDQTGAVAARRDRDRAQHRDGLDQGGGHDRHRPLHRAVPPVGEYEIVFSLTGLPDHTWRKGVDLHVNDRLTINAKLGVGGQETSVEVSAAAELIQSTPAVQNLMGPTQVQELPLNNRNFVQLATLVPGVERPAGRGRHRPDQHGLASRSAGARRNAVNWLVDGASNVDVGSNITLLSTPTLESIEEFKIITTSYAAEWPRSGGGIVNIVTKSRHQQVPGQRLRVLPQRRRSTRTRFFRNTEHATPTDLRGDARRKLDYNNFGYTIGGPLVKDRLFFFWSQEWRNIDRAPVRPRRRPCPTRRGSPIPTNAELRGAGAARPERGEAARGLAGAQHRHQPVPAAPAPNIQNTRAGGHAPRLEHRTRKWRLMGRYTHDLSETTEPGGLFFSIADPGHRDDRSPGVPGQVCVAQLTTTISSRDAERVLVPVLGQRDQVASTATNVTQHPRRLRPRHPGALPGEPRGPHPARSPSAGCPRSAPTSCSTTSTGTTRSPTTSPTSAATTPSRAASWSRSSRRTRTRPTPPRAFSFVAGGGRTAFQNFLTGNAGRACGSGLHLHRARDRGRLASCAGNRYEIFVQDSWKACARPHPRLRRCATRSTRASWT